MPYVLDYDTLYRSVKRRRVSTSSQMAGSGGRGAPSMRSPDTVVEHSVQEPIGSERPRYEVRRELPEVKTSDREEFMQCLKRGERPTWVSKPTLQALRDEEESQKEREQNHVCSGPTKDEHMQIVDDPFFGPWTESRETIQRTHSAFHAGDFGGQSQTVPAIDELDSHALFTESPTSPLSSTPPLWLNNFSKECIGRAISDQNAAYNNTMNMVSRRRAPSLGSSLSSSFVMRTPTSPLVHTVSNANVDWDRSHDLRSQDEVSGGKKTRRRTLPPNSYHSPRVSPQDTTTPNFSRPFVSPRTHSSMPYRSHQPRRSLSSFTYQTPFALQTPVPRERRPSLGTEPSARHRLSMVGVMGKADCPASLKCPAHVSVPFHAVFYHYPSSSNSRSISDDTPSPYVGTIDLERNLKPVLLGAKRARTVIAKDHPFHRNEDPRAPENTPIGKALARDSQQQKSQSPSPQISLGGAYRVPQKGQLQILIKNQNKTAVKLFLVPYDLEGMGSGTKTFVRQRSFSCGPILEDALSSTESRQPLRDPLKDKPILRYLVHLKFCCPAKGRYYLHDNIRLVFANRVPDGKEKLRNEVQLPEPRFSAFRPSLQIKSSPVVSQPILSSPCSRSPSLQGFLNELDPIHTPSQRISDEPRLFVDTGHTATVPPLMPALVAHPDRNESGSEPSAAHLQDLQTAIHHPAYTELFSFPETPSKPAKTYIPERTLSPVQGFLPSTSARSSPVPWGNSSSSTNRSFSPPPLEVGNGLLSRQFRTLNDQIGGDKRGLPLSSSSRTSDLTLTSKGKLESIHDDDHLPQAEDNKASMSNSSQSASSYR